MVPTLGVAGYRHIVGVVAGSPAALLIEDGFVLLLEDGGKMLLE